jgi:hypothetical protein
MKTLQEQRTESVLKMQERITKLEKENAKAKEIIKTFLVFAEAFGYSPSMDRFITEAEQFIKE